MSSKKAFWSVVN
uniref:Uncharacterized protein n=1 Tax=Anguilla anguilla TaxID=7936 RepID=A0A0E9QZC1_ANGAN